VLEAENVCRDLRGETIQNIGQHDLIPGKPGCIGRIGNHR
jgi:hypothetical protein